MKSMFILVTAASLLTVNAFAAGSEAIIKQRAKELRDQNNVRQGVPPPAPPVQKAANQNTAQAPALTPNAKLQVDLAAIKPNAQVTPEQKQKLTSDLMALAQGKKPSLGAANKLATDMSTALAQKTLSEGARSRLVQDLNAAFNPANIQALQMQDIVSDVQAVFQTAGVARKDAVTIADNVKAIAAELQKPAK